MQRLGILILTALVAVVGLTFYYIAGRGADTVALRDGRRLPTPLAISSPMPSANAISDGARKRIAINQIGYRPGDRKVAMVAGPAAPFAVVDAQSDQPVYHADLVLLSSHDPSSGETVYEADFSSVVAAGLYYLEVPGVGTSYSFRIDTDVFNQALSVAIGGFYLQRCGGAVEDGANGHLACHLEDGYLWDRPTARIDVTGGWHDAGDYGKYIPSGAKAIADLLHAFELYPDRFIDSPVLPPILDEARWELDWFRKMQRADGAVYHKVTPTMWSGDVRPEQDRIRRYVFGVSTAATADFAAVMAMAARIYAPFDADFAREARIGAERAWAYLERHMQNEPRAGFKNPPGVSTGEYGDADDSDERFWAAAELFRLTGEAKYDAYVLSNLSRWRPFFTRPTAATTREGDGALAYLFSNGNADVRGHLGRDLVNGAEAVLRFVSRQAYRVALGSDEFYWGSNGVALNRAMLLLNAERVTARADYANAALDQLHYILGRNVLAKSFVTGIGGNPVTQPHHQQAIAGRFAVPVPGLLSGGPNAIDSGLSPDHPAKAYVDDSDNFTVNETAIDMNSALVFVLARFAAPNEAIAGVAPEESANAVIGSR